MSEQELLALASLVRETSEVLWQIAKLKVYGEALQQIAWMCIFFTSLVGTSFGSLRAFWAAKKKDSETWETWGFIFVAGAILSLLAVGGFLGGAIIRLVAPDYFAIRVLLEMV